MNLLSELKRIEDAATYVIRNAPENYQGFKNPDEAESRLGEILLIVLNLISTH